MNVTTHTFLRSGRREKRERLERDGKRVIIAACNQWQARNYGFVFQSDSMREVIAAEARRAAK